MATQTSVIVTLHQRVCTDFINSKLRLLKTFKSGILDLLDLHFSKMKVL